MFLLIKNEILLFQRLVVCLEESIWIHDMRDLRVLHTIREVPQNNDGLCALSPNNDNPYLAYPGSAITGEIQIFDTNNLVSRYLYFDFKRLFFIRIETRRYNKCS